jgi:adenylate cyclase
MRHAVRGAQPVNLVMQNDRSVAVLNAQPHALSFQHAVREHLAHVFRSPQFDGSARTREFLQFVVDEALAGRGADLNQTAIATTVFHRTGDFDAVLDPIVRVQAGRVRRSLERYYLLSGDARALRIELPKGSYTPTFVGVDPDETPHALTVLRFAHAPAPMPRPAVLISPFTTFSANDSEDAALVKDALAGELLRNADVQVIRQRDRDDLDHATRPHIRFSLHGTLRRDADDLVISARLIDRTTAEQIWSDEYHTGATAGRWSGTVADIGRIIAARIGAEQGAISRALVAEHAAQRHATAGGFGAIVRCYYFLLSRRPSEFLPTMEALQQLTLREPGNAVAWTYLARLCVADHSFELSHRGTPIDKAITCAHEALMLDPASARARCVLAAGLLIKGECEAALLEIDRMLQLNATSLAYREVAGWVMALAGEWSAGVALMRETMRRNPYCQPHGQHGFWADYLRRGDVERAYTAALEYHDQTFFWREMMISCCLGLLGRLDEARASAAELLRLKPSFPERGRTLIGYYIKAPELRERIADGLQAAGLMLR